MFLVQQKCYTHNFQRELISSLCNEYPNNVKTILYRGIFYSETFWSLKRAGSFIFFKLHHMTMTKIA